MHSKAAELLAQGQPRAALALAQGLEGGAFLAAAAALRLGQTNLVRQLLSAQPPTARRALLLARAATLEADIQALSLAEKARVLARSEGDAPALVACVTLVGELQILDDAERFLPLRTLAEGLKVAEIVGQSADAHLLAVLAAAQRTSERKAAQTAQKALDRAQVGSPAQIGALLRLGRRVQASKQQQASELDERWLRVFKL